MHPGFEHNPNGEFPAIQRGLIDFPGGRPYGGSLPALGINADQRYPAHSAAADGDHMAASPQVGLHCFG